MRRLLMILIGCLLLGTSAVEAEGRTSALTDVGVGFRLNSPPKPRTNNPTRDSNPYWSGDWGLLADVSDRARVGAGIRVSGDSDGLRAGVLAHYRKRLGRSSSLDLAAGPLLLGSSEYDNLSFPGFSAHVQVMLADAVGATLAMERLRFENERDDTAYYLSGRLGSKPGMIASAAGAVVGLIAVAAVASTIGSGYGSSW